MIQMLRKEACSGAIADLLTFEPRTVYLIVSRNEAPIHETS